jgi:hypothetical protein
MRDHSTEQIFLTVYGQPVVQALLGLRATDESPRRHPGIEPEQIAFIEKRIAELRERIAEGGEREAFVRSLVYIGLAGPGVDERAFALLNKLRAEEAPDLTLQDFKDMVREQYFAILLDQKGAVAAISKMLPKDAAERKQAVEDLRQVVSATGKPEGVRAERLKEVEKLYAAEK